MQFHAENNSQYIKKFNPFGAVSYIRFIRGFPPRLLKFLVELIPSEAGGSLGYIGFAELVNSVPRPSARQLAGGRADI